MSIEAMKQALEALEQLQGGCTDSDDGTVEAITVWCPEVIDALRQAIEQAEQAQPVARILVFKGKGTYPKRGYTVSRTYEELPESTYPDDWEEGQKLYTTPPPSQPKQVEPVSIEIKKAIAVAIAGLSENHTKDVLEVFSTDQLVEILEFTRAYKAERVEEIYKQAWNQLTTPPPRQPEPVIDKSAAIRIATALGWTPPRQPLTDEQIDNIYTGVRAVHHEIDSYVFARAIEAACTKGEV
jgi:hypothetical protein